MKKNKNISVGYKDSAVGVIPKEWEVKDFVDIVRISSEKYVPTPKETFKCIELEHIEQQSGRILGWTTSSSQKSTKNKFKKGEVLFGKLRPYLCKFWHAEFEGVCSSEIWVLASKSEKILNEYLFYLIQSHRFIQKSNASSGTKMPRADWSYISLFPYALPLLKEQKKIAEILSTWDDAIEAQSKLVDKLKFRKQAIMQQLLIGKKRVKGFDKEWKEYRLGEIFERVEEINDGHEHHEIMTISARIGFISQDDKFDRVIAGDSLNKYTLIRKNDFAYNKGNSKLYQMGCIYQYKQSDSALVPFVYICFRPTDKVFADFYKHWFLNHGLDRQLKRIITSGARGDGLLNVNKDDFFSLTLIYPAIEEQTAIANILSTADKEIEIANAKLDKLREQKKGLMQQLLTGKKRVKLN